jgi:hypothetical protein
VLARHKFGWKKMFGLYFKDPILGRMEKRFAAFKIADMHNQRREFLIHEAK